MTTVTGNVQAKSTTKFGHGIMIEGNWYNSKFPIVCEKGDTVSFDDGDKKYVKGLKVLSSGGGVATKDTGAAVPASVARASGGYSRGAFPVPPGDGTRSIIRQNSVTNAVALVKTLIDNEKIPDGESLEAIVFEWARLFEAYSSGDIDEEVKREIDAQFEVK